MLTFLLAVEATIQAGLKKTRFQDFSVWNDLFSGKLQTSLLIQGNSRAWRHVSPAILESVLGLDAYNIGMDGLYFPMQKVRFDLYRKSNPAPRVCLQVLGIETLENGRKLYRIESFLPYLRTNDEVRLAVAQYDQLSFLQLHLPLLRYAAGQQLIEVGLLEFLGLRSYKADRVKGFGAHDWGWDGVFEAWKKEHPTGKQIQIDSEVVEQFNGFLQERKKDGTLVVLVYAPEYEALHPFLSNRAELLETYRSIAEKHGIPYLDYSAQPFSSQKDLFYNSTHMNKKGAEAFSRRLALDLLPLLAERGILAEEPPLAEPIGEEPSTH